MCSVYPLSVFQFFFSFVLCPEVIIDNECRIARSTILNIQHSIQLTCDKRKPMLRFIDCLHLSQIKIKLAFILIFVIQFHFAVFDCRVFYVSFFLHFGFRCWFAFFAHFYTHSVSMADSNFFLLSAPIYS